MTETPAAAHGGRAAAGTPATPEDFVAALAAMQDQIDDLTAVVEAHARRLAELEGNPVNRRSTARPSTRTPQ